MKELRNSKKGEVIDMITLMRCEENRTWWKKIFAVFIIIALIGSVAVLPTKAVKANDGLNLFYTITVEKDKPTFHVNIEIENLYNGKFRFGLTEGNTNHLEQYVTNLRVKQKELIKVVYIGNLTWEVTAKKGSITIDYDMNKIIPLDKYHIQTTQKICAVYIDNQCGVLFGQYAIMVPFAWYPYSDSSVKIIKVKFNLPRGWKIVAPYIDHGTYYEVPKVTNCLAHDFIGRQGVYFGKMRFYSERKTSNGNCTVRFGVLEEDQSWEAKYFLTTQADVDFYTQRTADALDRLSEVFGENPYPIFTMFTSFRSKNGWTYPGGLGLAGSNQYWTPNRLDEVVGHLFYSWMREKSVAPASSNYLICKGAGECYFGNKIAYEITGDRHYLGKIYANYLVYKRAWGTKYFDRAEIKDAYYKGSIVALFLDKLIQKETGGTKSLDNVMSYLYQKYKNTGHEIDSKDLENGVDYITGRDHSQIFKKYVYGNEEIPVQDIIQPYKDAFPEFIKTLDSDEWPTTNYHGSTIPFFINIEIALTESGHLPYQILCDDYYNKFAEYILQNYDVDNLTKKDIEASLTKLTGEDCTGFFEKWSNIYGEPVTLDQMKKWLRSYLPSNRDIIPPKIEIDSPADNSIVDINTVYVSGIVTDNESGIDKVTINDNEVSITSNNGSFFKEVHLTEGTNTITIIAIDKAGNKTTKIITVVYNPPVKTITIILKPGDPYMTVNGVQQEIDPGRGTKPVIIPKWSRTVVPIRAIVEALGGTIEWDGTERKVTINFNGTTIELWIDNPKARVNGETKWIDESNYNVKPVIINDRTMLPLRFVAESLGCDVNWDNNTRTITITYK